VKNVVQSWNVMINLLGQRKKFALIVTKRERENEQDYLIKSVDNLVDLFLLVSYTYDMKDLIKNALDDMSKKVTISKNHIYTNNETGIYLQGVSTISSIIPKDWLAAWGAKEAVKFLGYSDYEGDVGRAKEVLTQIANCKTPEEYIAILKEAKGASTRKSKDALIDGKSGHAWLETYIQAKLKGKNIPMLPGGTLDRPLTQFLEWERENIEEWIASEALVAYPEKGYAGTLDAIAVGKNNELCLIDFKFASHISEDYYLQTAGYAACFEPYDIRFDKRIIIRLPKTLEKEEWNSKEFKYEKIPNNLEVQIVPTLYTVDRDAFLHTLALKSWINMVLKVNK